MSTEALRDLLATGGTPPPLVPDRTARVRQRVRRRTLRRRAVAATAVAVLAVAGTAVYLAPSDPPAESLTAPGTYVAPDGAVYHRTEQHVLSLADGVLFTTRLRNRGYPLAVLATCAEPAEVSIGLVRPVASTGLPKSDFSGNRTVPCGPDTVPADLPTSGELGDSTFNATLSHETPATAGRWTLTFYEWTPPAGGTPPPAPVPTPQEDQAEVARRSGIWPRTRSFTMTVPADTGDFTVAVACAGAIDRQVLITVRASGTQVAAFPCVGEAELNQAAITHTRGRPLTLTFALTPNDPIYLKRPGSWTVLISRPAP